MFVQKRQPADRMEVMGSTRNKMFAAIAVLALVGAGCSSGTGSTGGTDPTTDTASSTAPESTAAATTTSTTVEPATTDATTTAPESTAAASTTSTTAAPATTTGNAGPTEADLVAAVAANTKAWVDCAAASPQCDPESFAATRSGDQLQSSADIARAGNTNGTIISNLDSYRVQLESVEFVDDTIAMVTTCTEDELVVSTSSGEVINDDFISSRTTWTYVLFDGVWKVTTGFENELKIGLENTLCEF